MKYLFTCYHPDCDCGDEEEDCEDCDGNCYSEDEEDIKKEDTEENN